MRNERSCLASVCPYEFSFENYSSIYPNYDVERESSFNGRGQNLIVSMLYCSNLYVAIPNLEH